MTKILIATCVLFATSAIARTVDVRQSTLAYIRGAYQLGQTTQPCVSLTMFKALQNKSIASDHPAWMMGERYVNLEETLKGYRSTGVPLVAFDGERFVPASRTDDVGLDYLIPKVAVALNLDLVAALKLVLVVLYCGAFLSGVAALFLSFRDWLERIVVLVCLLPVAFISYKAGDLYAVQSAVVVGTVPWFLYLARKRRSGPGLVFLVLVIGVIAGICDLVRTGSGVGVVIFVFCIVIFSSGRTTRQRILLVSALLLGAVVPRLSFVQLLHSRDTFLARHQPDYSPTNGVHPFWHSVYIGLGFLSNPYVDGYKDEVAVQTVCAVAPQVGYVSEEYESVLKGKVWLLLREHPEFVLETLAAKLGVITLFLLLFSHVGLVSALRYPKDWPLELSFACALIFNALFGILVVPHYAYLLGFVAFAAVYAVFSICHAMSNGMLVHFHSVKYMTRWQLENRDRVRTEFSKDRTFQL